MADRPRTKVGDLAADDHRPPYKSWKKKYRKMRRVFDAKMGECEGLHRQEARAQALVKRLAIENDRLLDLLYDNNECAQIPPNKRIDLNMEPDGQEQTTLTTLSASFHKLLAEVPHMTYAELVAADGQFAQDMEPFEGDEYPQPFLTPDEVDNYLYELDMRLAPAEAAYPTLAPVARGAGNAASRDFSLKNPTSVYNWLRKHAPNTFLQDGEDKKSKTASTPNAKGRGSLDGEDEGVTPGKAKRKREEEGRPRSGGSISASGGRPAKKKRRSDGGP